MKVFAIILVITTGLAAGISTADCLEAIVLEQVMRQVPTLESIKLDVGWQVPAALSVVFVVLLACLIFGTQRLEDDPSVNPPDELVLLRDNEVFPEPAPSAHPRNPSVTAVSPQRCRFRAGLAEDLEVIEKGLRVLPDPGSQPAVGYQTPLGEIDVLAVDRDGGLAVIVFDWGDDPDSACASVLAYVGWVKAHLSAGRRVRGLLLLKDIADQTRYALSDIEDVDFYKLRWRFEVELGSKAPMNCNVS